MKKILSICLIFCLCLAVPAMAAGNATANITQTEHGERGDVNPVVLAKLLADGVINEDDYNRMIGIVVENQQTNSTTTPEAPVNDSIQMVTEPETVTAIQAEEIQEQVTAAEPETVTAIQAEEIQEQVTAAEPETVAATQTEEIQEQVTAAEPEQDTGFIRQIISMIQGLFSGV